MEAFEGLPSGNFALDLDEANIDAETVPGSPDRVSSTTSATVESIEIQDSDHCSSVAEIVGVSETIACLSPEEEIQKMQGEERYGYLHRVELRAVESIEIQDSDRCFSSVAEIVGVSETIACLSPEEEIQKMQGEERYGYLHRVELRALAVQARLSTVRQAIADESPQERRVRRMSFRRQVYGEVIP